MRVTIYEINQATGILNTEPLDECELVEALPEPDEEQALAYQALRDTGAHLIGGGASPLVLLVKVGTPCPVFRHITGG